MRRLNPALLFALTLAFSCGVRAGETPDLDYMARLLFDAYRTQRLYPDLIRVNPGLDDRALYAIQRRYVGLRLGDGDAVAGYKGGFMAAAPIGGVLYGSGILSGSPVVRADDFRILAVEAEIAFRFCARVTRPLPDAAALKRVVCGIHPAVELPDTALPELAVLKDDFPHLRKALIMTNMTTSHVLLGPARDPATVALDRLTVETRHDGVRIGRRDADDVRGDLWQDVLWVVNGFVLEHGYTIDAGHIVIPGNLTGIHPGRPGRYRIDFGALGVIDFTVAGSRDPDSGRPDDH